MDTQIRFLRTLEEDLNRAVVRERESALRRDRKRRSLGKWTAIAAAFVMGAWAIGTLSTGVLGSGADQAVPADAATGAATGSDGERGPLAEEPEDEAPEDLTKIVRDGKVSLEVPVDTFDESFGQVVEIAEVSGGFVLASETQGPDAGTLTLQIPAARFDAVFVEVRKLGVVTASKVTGEDVTAEFIDLSARLTILRARREVLLELMAEADTIAETVTVQNHLDETQRDIERIEGELRFLKEQVASSTLQVSIVEKGAEAVRTTGAEIENPNLGRAFDRAIQGFFGVVAAVVVGLGYLIPVAAIAGVVWLVVMLARRRGLAATPGP
jgi:hypothetical protein